MDHPDIVEARRLVSNYEIQQTTACLHAIAKWSADKGGLSRLLSLVDAKDAEIEVLKACLHAKVEFAIDERAAYPEDGGLGPQIRGLEDVPSLSKVVVEHFEQFGKHIAGRKDEP